MKLFTKNGIEVNISEKDFIAGGGFGKVYKKSNTAYKIYDNPQDMLPIGKIQELSCLDDNDIIRPNDILYNKTKTNPIGYSMRFVKGSPICELFTSTYKKRNSIDNKMVLDLASKFYKKLDFVHSKDILVVDVNELNFLISDNYKDIYFIDTDGYKTKSYNATGIMDSIRDRHCKNVFTKETDWFSWGILIIQLALGIHPYRGGHPDFDSVDAADRLNLRMIKNVSIFNKNSRLPRFCPEIKDTIPSGLRQWMEAVYENGKRIKPPEDFESKLMVVKPNVQSFKGTNIFDINLLNTYNFNIIDYYSYEGDSYVIFSNGLLFNNKYFEFPSSYKGNNHLILHSKDTNSPYLVYSDVDFVKIFDLTNQKFIDCSFSCSNLFRVENRIYGIKNDHIYELKVSKIGKNCFSENKIVGNVLDMQYATRVFDGLLIQNVLGKYMFSILPKSSTCHQINIKELDNCKIINAKYEKNVLVAICSDSKNSNFRAIIKFSTDFSEYYIDIKKNIVSSDINFTVNDNGIVVLINDEEKLEIFSSNYKSQSVKILDDGKISSDMLLSNNGSKILFYSLNDKNLYSISERK